mmetsp:Transcript_34936/g.82850  ORF Transcript_34936/g.82850 Transcript_34936/m.82850 type:complete len:249 (-) Transcript_34936:2545-3291(-)
MRRMEERGSATAALPSYIVLLSATQRRKQRMVTRFPASGSHPSPATASEGAPVPRCRAREYAPRLIPALGRQLPRKPLSWAAAGPQPASEGKAAPAAGAPSGKSPGSAPRLTLSLKQRESRALWEAYVTSTEARRIMRYRLGRSALGSGKKRKLSGMGIGVLRSSISSAGSSAAHSSSTGGRRTGLAWFGRTASTTATAASRQEPSTISCRVSRPGKSSSAAKPPTDPPEISPSKSRPRIPLPRRLRR